MEVRMAGSRDMEEVYRLTYRAYSDAGYCEHKPNGKLRHYPHLDEINETYVLIAIKDGLVVGTVSLTVDGPNMLHVDEDFPREVHAIRCAMCRAGEKLAGCWRIVTDPASRYQLKIIRLLLSEVSSLAYELGVDSVLATFHPKHERFYQRIVGFHTIARGESRSVGGQGAVLMRINRSPRWLCIGEKNMEG